MSHPHARRLRSSSFTSEPLRRPRSLQPAGYLWLLPALIVSVGLLYYSIGYTGVISTLDWDGSSPDPRSVGGGNYVALLQDPIFWTAIRNTVVFFVVTFVVQTVLGLVFAALLHSRARLGVIYKVFVFVPVVLAPAFMAPVFRQIFAADGPFNWFLEHIGLGFAAQSWLADTSTALGIVTAVAIWNGTGLNFVLYYAAIGQIDPEMLEASRIDGAGNLRVLTSMVFPSVRGTTLALGILSAIGALKTFDIPYLVTAAGPNHATEFLGTYIYTQSIPQGHVGYGAALSIMLLLVAIVMAVVSGVRNRRAA